MAEDRGRFSVLGAATVSHDVTNGDSSCGDLPRNGSKTYSVLSDEKPAQINNGLVTE